MQAELARRERKKKPPASVGMTCVGQKQRQEGQIPHTPKCGGFGMTGTRRKAIPQALKRMDASEVYSEPFVRQDKN